MRLVFMGTPRFAVPSFESLVAAGHDVASVVTRPDRPRRHGAAAPEPSPVGVAAAARGVPLLTPPTLREPGAQDAIATLHPELIVVVAYGQILPPAILALPVHGCVNLHASILPRWRGAAPIARAVMAGDAATGVTTMRMNEGLDTGDILEAEQVAIGPGETAGELTERLAEIGARLLVGTVAAIGGGGLRGTPQDHGAATWAPPLRREEATLDWTLAAPAVAARIRGLNPWPMAETGRRGERLQLLRAVAEPGPPAEREPGTILEAAGDRLVVACGGGTRLRLLELRRPGRGALTAREAINGRLVGDGDRFAPLGG